MPRIAVLAYLYCACSGLCVSCSAAYALPALELHALAARRSHADAQVTEQGWHWLVGAGLAFQLGNDPLRAPGLPLDLTPEPAPPPQSAPCANATLCSWEQLAGELALAELTAGGG